MRIILSILGLFLISVTISFSQSPYDKQQLNQNQLNQIDSDKYIQDGMVPPSSLTSSNNIIPGSGGLIRCGTDQHVALRNVTHPRDKTAIRTIRQNAQSRVANFIGCDASNSIVIPVAVHYGQSFDCTDTQCLIDAALGNIASMNEDFAALNADISYYNTFNAACPGSYPLDVVSDGTCITFCLATQNHPASEGILDGEPAITVGQYNWTGGVDAPAFAGYFNIFVEANTGGLGIAAAPGQANGDGVQVDAQTFGGPGISCSSGAALNTNTTYNLGRTLTHEAGHYFDLFHTFQGGCPDGDTGTFSGQVGVINDTPGTANPFFGCPTVTSCADVPASGCASLHAQITNYMDYTDDACMVMFTQDQAAVMNGWANSLPFVSDATACDPAAAPSSLAACRLNSAFGPADGSTIVACTDDGSAIDFIDMSTNGPSTWNWTFTVTGGNITLSTGTSTMQNPSPVVTGGTTGTIDVTLEVCDAAGVCNEVTQSYTINVASGADCPDDCEFTLNLTDDFGDGWNGATVEIFVNGTSIGVFGGTFSTGGVDGPYVILLTDGATIDVVQTSGGFPSEEGFTLVDPFGFTVAQLIDGAPLTQSFTAYCDLPTCDDGIQNGDENGIDCGGSDCDPCPICATGLEEILDENFDGCALPAGWTVSATGGGVADIIFTGGPTDVPGGGTASPDFSGCIAIIDDDANDAIGVGCITSPIIDMSLYLNGTLTFDWQNNDFAGTGDFYVEVWDGTMWVQVFIEMNDAFGTNTLINLAAYTNTDFQIRFCYDDEGAFAWGAGFDNVAVCGELNNICPAEITPNDISGNYCDGTDAVIFANANGNVTYAWSSSNPNIAIVDAAAASTFVEFSALTPCQIETADISLVATCSLDGVELFNGIVSTVSVYPAPPADITTLVVLNENTCDEPVLVDPNCAAFITLTPDPANPTFPVTGTVTGTALYTVTYASPAGGPDCCPETTGAITDLITDGSFEGGPGAGTWVEASTTFGTPICDVGGCGTGTGTGPSTGTFWAWFGGVAASEVGSVCQTITVPTNQIALDLTFDLEAIQCDSPADFMEVTVNGVQVFLVDGSSSICGVLGYSNQTVDLLAAGVGAGTATLCFESEIFANNGSGSNFFVDNVAVIAEEAPAEDICEASVSGMYNCIEGEDCEAKVGSFGKSSGNK